MTRDRYGTKTGGIDFVGNSQISSFPQNASQRRHKVLLYLFAAVGAQPSSALVELADGLQLSSAGSANALAFHT
jgi:hypothetical protein